MSTLEPYIFAKLGARIGELRAQGMDVIRLDMGSPDLPPAPFIIEALQQSAARPASHGYTSSGGSTAYAEAVATYYGRRFGVELDPATEVVGLIGSKEGIFHISMAVLDPGDAALVPDPGYPTYTAGARFAGAEVVYLPLRTGNDFLPDLSAIPSAALRRAKLLWLNYPNNPTGAVAPERFFVEAVNFARTHNLLLCHDAPYTDVTFDGYRAPSLLQVPGAKEVAVEFNSLSKSYNMGGWRLGMAVGNAEALSALRTLKSNVDSSHFQSVLDTGVAALTGDQSWLAGRNAVYRERRDIVLEGLGRAGLRARTPQAAIYVWAQVPAGPTSAAFATALLEEAGVSITPGSAFGACGEGYVRLSLGTPTQRVREAMGRVVRWRVEGWRVEGRGVQ